MSTRAGRAATEPSNARAVDLLQKFRLAPVISNLTSGAADIIPSTSPMHSPWLRRPAITDGLWFYRHIFH